MVNASGHIEQQLSKLQTRTADIATDLEALVDSYLQVLSEASKRQLVLAAYHICTQIYPESFLKLSLSQRNRLQKHLQELGNQIREQLDEKWNTAKQLSLRPAEEDGLAVIRQLFLEAASIREQSKPTVSPEVAEDAAPTSEGVADQTVPENFKASEHPKERLLAEIRTLMDGEKVVIDPSEPTANDDETAQEAMQPAQLMRRQILIEKAIRDVLKSVSEKANELLQKADVMPEVPKALLAAASETDRLGHVPMKTPNLVRLSIKVLHEPDKDGFEPSDGSNENAEDESQWPDDADVSATIIDRETESDDENKSESEESAEEAMMMPQLLQLESLPNFVLIHLRLAEIEFAETNVAVWRNRIRKKMAQLKRVGHAYKDAERQLAIAQAEDAWRASWTND